MDVGAAAGLIDERLGHEAGEQALILGNGLDRAAQVDGIVTGEQGVRAVLEIDLELARCVFGDGGVGRNPLDRADLRDRVGECPVVVQILDVVDLGRVVAGAGRGIDRGAWPAIRIEFAIEQIELQFDGNHWRETAIGEPLEHPAQDFPRAGGERSTLAVLHVEQALQGGSRQPWHRTQGAGDRAADAILVADVVAEPRFLDGVAGDVGGDQRHRQADALGEHLFQGHALDALAAQQAIEVRQQQIDGTAIGMASQDGGIGGVECGWVHGRGTCGLDSGVPDTSRGQGMCKKYSTLRS